MCVFLQNIPMIPIYLAVLSTRWTASWMHCRFTSSMPGHAVPLFRQRCRYMFKITALEVRRLGSNIHCLDIEYVLTNGRFSHFKSAGAGGLPREGWQIWKNSGRSCQPPLLNSIVSISQITVFHSMRRT